MPDAPRLGWQVWTALGLVYVVWGSTYLAIRYVVADLPPLLSGGARFLLAGVLMAGYLAVRKGRAGFRGERRQWWHAAGVGVLLLLGGNGLVSIGEDQHLPSGLAALLVAGVPLYVVVLSALGHDRAAPRTVLGVVIGFAGLAVLLLPGARPGGVPLGAAALVVGSSVLWSLGSVLATRISLPPEPLAVTVGQMVGGSLAMLAAGLLRGERLHPSAVTGPSLAALAYLVVFGSLVAFTAYSWLLGAAPVSTVSTYAYVNPVVAVLLGALVAGEKVTATGLAGGAVTVLAVAIVVSEQGRRRYPPVERQGRVRSSRT